ncbi:LacI family DNA-binding transcriptional regulator [Alicyclobacillus acidiphilus]|uniref:LacI family DNA-binding transcriptional regulator n=1 Tax=Alicyclobacillus acidiphilus TaxID=182455 RepID=UPI0008301055|nr:LacI family DNA-binding transcriptional regulator [Alicyclobacillus acidiphilus]
MVTIQEVAKRAKVSTATVSRVLNNIDGVKEATRARVLDAIRELDYHPSSIGRNLRLQESHTVMVLIPDVTNPFFSGIVQSIELTAHKYGYDVLLFDLSGREDALQEVDAFIDSRKIDGVIFLASTNHVESLRRFAEKCTIVVACEYVDNVDIPSVSVDNIAAAIEAVNYLISLGHRDILFLNPKDRDRLRGYRIALEQSGIPVRPEFQIEAGSALSGGYIAIERAIAEKLDFSAVFCANDLVAIGAMKAAAKHGIRVPHDLSVVGFDGLQFGEYTLPSLTTVSQPIEEIGRRAMEIWVRIHRGEVVDYPVRVQHTLTIRESCAPRK